MDHTLISCVDCGQHSLATACTCAHCGSKLRDCGARSYATAALLGLTTLSGCIIYGDQPEYGVPDSGWIDADADGWTVAEGDCDDDNATIHPDAAETPGDGVDSNCDGSDDT